MWVCGVRSQHVSNTLARAAEMKRLRLQALEDNSVDERHKRRQMAREHMWLMQAQTEDW